MLEMRKNNSNGIGSSPPKQTYTQSSTDKKETNGVEENKSNRWTLNI